MLIIKKGKIYIVKSIEENKSYRYEYSECNDSILNYLFQNIYIESLTIRDIFNFYIDYPELDYLFKKYDIQNILKIYKKHNETIVNANYEYIELSMGCNFSDYTNELSNREILDVFTVSPVLKNDMDEHKKGDRIKIDVSYANFQSLYDLPIITNTFCQSYNNDIYSTNYALKGPSYNIKCFTLGQILNSIFYHMSFFNEGNVGLELIEDLKVVINDLIDEQENKNKQELTVLNDITDLIGFSYILGFVIHDDTIDKRKLERLMFEVPNHVDISEFIYTCFKEKISIREDLVGLNAYEFRKFQSVPREEVQKSIVKEKYKPNLLLEIKNNDLFKELSNSLGIYNEAIKFID